MSKPETIKIDDTATLKPGPSKKYRGSSPSFEERFSNINKDYHEMQTNMNTVFSSSGNLKERLSTPEYTLHNFNEIMESRFDKVAKMIRVKPYITVTQHGVPATHNKTVVYIDAIARISQLENTIWFVDGNILVCVESMDEILKLIDESTDVGIK